MLSAEADTIIAVMITAAGVVCVGPAQCWPRRQPLLCEEGAPGPYPFVMSYRQLLDSE